ncbi:MAG: glutathione S-transferase family protein [Bosea sp. (in: a-proteobacteria)]
MLTIWGRLNSINVQKVVWAANEAGQPFTHIIAGAAFGKNDTPEYRAMNPNGLIPLLQDEGLVIWESNAIVRYISAKYACGSLWAEDAGMRSVADRWMDWQATEFNPGLAPAFMNLIRTAADKRDMAAIETAVLKTEPRMAILDAHLAQHSYLAGDHFTMADIAVGASVHRWLNIPVQRKEWKNVRHWYEALVARPAVQGVLTLPIT